MPTRRKLIGRIAALAALYFALAKLGLAFATVGRSVTLVWPPTGLALAALLLRSRRLWPGVALGAFVVNVTTPGVGPLVAAAIAVGNTLEAFVGVSLVRRASFRTQLDRTRDIVRFAIWGAGVAPAVGATVGASALVLAGLVPRAALVGTWKTWWLGDAMGALVFAPVLLCFGSRAEEDERRSWPETLALFAALLAAGMGALSRPHQTRPYIVFPPLIWAALRFGPRGASAATLLVAAIAIGSTVTGHGAFVSSTLGDDLTALHAFVGSVALTALVLGATAVERERAIRAREHFISIASHELRTPLAPLRLQVQRVLRRMRREPMPQEEVLAAIVVIDRQTTRLTALLEDVLDLTRLRIGRLSLAREPVDLAEIVEEVSASQRDALTQVGRELRITRHGPTIGEWDRVRLEQVVTNLLINAIKYGAGLIELDLEGSPAALSLTVRDYGPGVADADRERIFAPFEHAASDGTGRGLGLGLYIAREIVEAHGGRITVENPEGGGAAFRIELPVVPGRLRPIPSDSGGGAFAARIS
ncbi:MAG TPA: MASE1 domain-containing protein [Polyangia bacterium]|nr:MASE1 domain-containing protein [Polyangia bacterium]